MILCAAEPEAVVVTDVKGAVIHANTRFAALVGYEMKTLIDLNISSLVPSPVAQLMPGALKVQISLLG